MLKWRLITALILIPLVFAAIIYLNTLQFRWLSFAVMGWAFWEWAGFCRFPESWLKLLFTVTGLALTAVFSLISPVYIIQFSAVAWLLATIWVITYERSTTPPVLPSSVIALSGIWILSAFWIGLNELRDLPVNGISYLIFSLLLVFATDTGAYFVGRACGKHKLAVNISAGKTWEGVIGGICASGLLGCVGAWYFWPTTKTRLVFVFLCLFIGAISVVGDLLESLFKRGAGLKDSSHILPGHGGLMDRLDSLSAAIPLFALGLLLMHRL